MNLFDLCKAIKIQNEDPLDTDATFDDFFEDEEAADIILSINSVNNSICNSNDWNFREAKTTFQTVIAEDENLSAKYGK